MSQEFEYLHRKSRCKLLIGGDDFSNDVITLGTCFSMFVYICASFCFTLIVGNLTAQSTGSHRGIGSGIQIPETQLQAILHFHTLSPEQAGELARRLCRISQFLSCSAATLQFLPFPCHLFSLVVPTPPSILSVKVISLVVHFSLSFHYLLINVQLLIFSAMYFQQLRDEVSALAVVINLLVFCLNPGCSSRACG